MNYLINEGTFILPVTEIQDMTMNILKFKELDTTLVISRSSLKDGETLAASFNRQMKQLEKGMKNFILKERKHVEIGKDKKLSGIEAYNQFETDEHFI